MKNNLHPHMIAGPAWHFHWLDLSVADMVVVGLMIAVFLLALFIPFPGGHNK